jgi:hypothetical protein
MDRHVAHKRFGDGPCEYYTDTESSSNMKRGKFLDQVNDTKDCISYS